MQRADDEGEPVVVSNAAEPDDQSLPLGPEDERKSALGDTPAPRTAFSLKERDWPGLPRVGVRAA